MEAFLLTPLREGRLSAPPSTAQTRVFLLTPLREGRPKPEEKLLTIMKISTHAPAGGATRCGGREGRGVSNFYSRPCGRGDSHAMLDGEIVDNISTHAPAGGATQRPAALRSRRHHFYSRPCGRGDGRADAGPADQADFYSRPCGRGDAQPIRSGYAPRTFLLTPLREGRQQFSTSPS